MLSYNLSWASYLKVQSILFSALMDRIPEVHTKWSQVQFRISKQKFEIYISLVNHTNMQIYFTFPEDSGPTTKKFFKITTTLKYCLCNNLAS